MRKRYTNSSSTTAELCDPSVTGEELASRSHSASAVYFDRRPATPGRKRGSPVRNLRLSRVNPMSNAVEKLKEPLGASHIAKGLKFTPGGGEMRTGATSCCPPLLGQPSRSAPAVDVENHERTDSKTWASQTTQKTSKPVYDHLSQT